ncbi:MAG: flagellar biosynthetic protein FliO [Candidatus Tectimicrobiota bacterium]
MSRQHRQDVMPGCGLLGLCSALLVYSCLCTGSALAQPATALSPAEAAPSQAQPQERFLQHFMNQSLGKEASQSGAGPTPPSAIPAPASPLPAAAPATPALPSAPPPVDLTTTTLKMVLALGAMLGLLMLVGYGLRRYFLDQSPLSKRQGALRVIGRVSLTPKASVALLEVPGKVLVVGITGTSLTALGEVALPLTAAPAAARDTIGADPESVAAPVASFAATLDAQRQPLGTPPEPPEHADMLLRVSEAIQQKVSRLKQL